MLIRVHYPTTEAGMKELADRVAMVHAESVIAYINNLPLNRNQKLAILESAMRKLDSCKACKE